jgi:hypothetical protein
MKKKIFILLLFVSLLETVIAQDYPDIRLIQDVSRSGLSEDDQNYLESVYKAGTQKLSGEWISADFSLDAYGYYSTGRYPGNATLSTRSPLISLPHVEENQKLILELKGFCQTEYLYDSVFISVSTNGGVSFTPLTTYTGWKIYMREQIDISEYTGKDVIFLIQLISDEKHEEEGLGLESIHIFTTEIAAPSFSRTRATGRKDLRLQPSEVTSGYDISSVYPDRIVNVGVNIENLPANIRKEDVEVFIYIDTAFGNNFEEYEVEYKNDPANNGDFYFEIPSSFIRYPYFKYYFTAKIPGIEEDLIYPNPPFEVRTVAVRNNYPPPAFFFYEIHGDCIRGFLANEENFRYFEESPLPVIKRLYCRPLGSNDPYIYFDFQETSEEKVQNYYCFTNEMLPELLEKYNYFLGVPKYLFKSDLEIFFYMEAADGTQGIRYKDFLPGWENTSSAGATIRLTKESESEIIYPNYSAPQEKFDTICNVPLTKKFKIINLKSCEDAFISSITSSNEHFTISPIIEDTVRLGFDHIFTGDYSTFPYTITYDGLADTTAIITIIANIPDREELKFIIEGKKSDCCMPVSLSSNPITSESHTLSFTLEKESPVKVYLFNEAGENMTEEPVYSSVQTLPAGIHEVSLANLLDKELDPEIPYILVINTDASVSYAYVYISKL